MNANNSANSNSHQNLYHIIENMSISKDKKQEIMFSHKASLEKTLSLIKIFQLKAISNSVIIKNNLSNIKQILLLFKDNLKLSLNDKEKELKQIKIGTEAKNNEMKKVLFSTEKNMTYFSEIYQLKTLNFEIENKIRSTDYEIDIKSKLINSYVSSINKEEEINNNFTNEKNLKIDDILGAKLNEAKYKLIDTKKEIKEREKEIDLITNKIIDLKKIVKENKSNEDIKNKNESREESNNFASTKLNTKNDGIKNSKKDGDDYDIQSFHSSIYTDSYSVNQDEYFKIYKNHIAVVDMLNVSNDNINTENSNNVSNKTVIFNKNHQKQNVDDNYIFANMSDNE